MQADSKLASYFKTEPKTITATTAAVAAGVGPSSPAADAEQETSKQFNGDILLDAFDNGTNGNGTGFSFQFNFGANL